MSKGVVGAEHDPLRPDLIEQEAQRAGRVGDAVVEQAAEALHRVALEPRARFLAHLPAVAESARLVGHEAAGVGQAEADARVALDDAAEDEGGSGDRRFQRVADEVGQVVGAHPLGGDDLVRVHQHEKSVAVRHLPNRVERGVVEVAATDVGAEMEAAQPVNGDRALQRRGGARRVLHRRGGEADEALRVLPAQGADRGILDLGDRVRRSRVGLVEEGVRDVADDVGVHALRRHVGEAALEVPGGAREGVLPDVEDLEDRRLVVDARQARREGGHLARDLGDHRLGQDVGVGVDDGHGGSGRGGVRDPS